MPARVWSPSCLLRAKEKGVGWRSEDGECLKSLLRRVARREAQGAERQAVRGLIGGWC